MRTWPTLGFLVLGLVACFGCTFSELDLTDLECPCGEGFSCDEDRGICVKGFLRPDRAEDGSAGVDAGPFDSGPGDSGGVDTPTDISRDTPPDSEADIPPTSASYCDGSPEGIIYCNGFESLGLEGSEGGTGTILRDTTRVFRGNGSLRSSVPNGPVTAYLSTPSFDSGSPETVYVQMRMFVQSEPVIAGAGIFGIFGTLDSMAVTLERDGGVGLSVFGSFPSSAGYTLPRDAWVCLRLVLELGPVGSVNVLVDDERLLTETGVDFTQLGEIDSLGIGVTFTVADHGPGIMRHDEIIVTSTPLSCADSM